MFNFIKVFAVATLFYIAGAMFGLEPVCKAYDFVNKEFQRASVETNVKDAVKNAVNQSVDSVKDKIQEKVKK